MQGRRRVKKLRTHAHAAFIAPGEGGGCGRRVGGGLQGSGSLAMSRTNACAAFITSGEVSGDCTISTSIICATGLKKWMPTRRSGRWRIDDKSCSGMLEVFEARM